MYRRIWQNAFVRYLTALLVLGVVSIGVHEGVHGHTCKFFGGESTYGYFSSDRGVEEFGVAGIAGIAYNKCSVDYPVESVVREGSAYAVQTAFVGIGSALAFRGNLKT